MNKGLSSSALLARSAFFLVFHQFESGLSGNAASYGMEDWRSIVNQSMFRLKRNFDLLIKYLR